MLFKYLTGIFSAILLVSAVPAGAVVIDRTIAVVDDQAITQVDLEKKYLEFRSINRNITYPETLQTMTNRILLLKEARKFRMEGDSDDDLIRQYIDLKIRALVKIQEKDIRRYFDENRAQFKDKRYLEVSGEIMKYLTELEVNARLKKHIESLREKARIIINSRALEEMNSS